MLESYWRTDNLGSYTPGGPRMTQVELNRELGELFRRSVRQPSDNLFETPDTIVATNPFFSVGH